MQQVRKKGDLCLRIFMGTCLQKFMVRKTFKMDRREMGALGLS